MNGSENIVIAAAARSVRARRTDVRTGARCT
jgi:hypothetical protein